MIRAPSARVAWVMWGVAVVAIVGGVVCQMLSPRELTPAFLQSGPLDIVDNLTVLGLPTIGLLVATRRRENPLGWVFLLAGLGLGFGNGGIAYALYTLQIDPGVLPGGHLTGWIANWCWTLGIGTLPFLLLLFPNGSLLSRRWRPAAWGAVIASTALTVSAMVFATSTWSDPLAGDDVLFSSGVARLVEPLFLGSLAAVTIFSFVGLASTVLRYRRSRGEERLQMKWFTAAVTFLVVMLAGAQVSSSYLLDVASPITLISLYAAMAIAILKYRLYEIDVVIKRTVQVAVLAAGITLVYVAIVVAVPALIRGAGDGGGIDPLPLVAAAVVAVAFDPLRRGAKRVADRLVYGERATPYEVLTAFGARVGETYSTDDVLPRMAQMLAQGTGAISSSVWLRLGSELRREASWPEGVDGRRVLRVTNDTLPAFDGEHGVGVRHQGKLLGALTVAMPPSEPFDPAKEALVRDLAAHAGLLLRNVALIEDLRASRQRLVAAQDEERRKLERDIHDGVQQQLVALAVQLKLARTLVDRDAEKAGQVLDTLQGVATSTLEDLRDLARGIYPPLLADKGLAAALESQARKAAVPTTVESEDIGRYPRGVESAVYFCTLEALNNVAKYAEASHADVRLAQTNGHLTFTVHDDGRGFDRGATSFGTGLQGMIDRLDAVGGTLSIESEPGTGTTVTGRVPVLGSEAAA